MRVAVEGTDWGQMHAERDWLHREKAYRGLAANQNPKVKISQLVSKRHLQVGDSRMETSPPMHALRVVPTVLPPCYFAHGPTQAAGLL